MTDNETYERISLLEAQVRFLAERLEVELPNFTGVAQSDLPPEIKDMVARGDKMSAIKAYREAAGVDIATAMRVINSL